MTRSTLSAEDRVAIEEVHKAWLNAELRGDSGALLRLCTASPVWLPPNESPLCGSATIQKWLEGQPQVVILRIEIDDLVISGIGSFAWKLAAFHTTLEGPAESGTAVVTGSHGWLLQRDDAGVWRVSVVAWAIAAPAMA